MNSSSVLKYKGPYYDYDDERQKPKPKPPKNYGWTCPACGCGNSPWSTKCGHCKPKPKTGIGTTERW